MNDINDTLKGIFEIGCGRTHLNDPVSACADSLTRCAGASARCILSIL
jgi:hypothetical protein